MKDFGSRELREEREGRRKGNEGRSSDSGGREGDGKFR